MNEIPIALPNTLTPEEWRCLAEFKRRAAELRAAKVFSTRDVLKASISVSEGDGFKVDVTGLPDEDALRSLLVTFRLFFLNDEPSNFRRVVNILTKHTKHDALRVYLGQLRDRWKGALFRSAMFLHLDDGVVDAERILDVWLNAHYFHGDQEKEQALEALKASLTPDLIRYMLVDAVVERSRVVFTLHSMLENLECPPAA